MRSIWAICKKSWQKCSRAGQKKFNHVPCRSLQNSSLQMEAHWRAYIDGKLFVITRHHSNVLVTVFIYIANALDKKHILLINKRARSRPGRQRSKAQRLGAPSCTCRAYPSAYEDTGNTSSTFSPARRWSTRFPSRLPASALQELTHWALSPATESSLSQKALVWVSRYVLVTQSYAFMPFFKYAITHCILTVNGQIYDSN